MTHSSPGSAEGTLTDQLRIRELIESRERAHQRKDASAIAAPYATGAVRYDLAPPLVHRGIDVPGLEKWLGTWDGPVTIDTHDLQVAVDGALAVAYGLTRMRGRKAAGGGRDVDLWFRTTVALQKQGGAWQIVHEHESVPFYMDGSDRAALDLSPTSAQ